MGRYKRRRIGLFSSGSSRSKATPADKAQSKVDRAWRNFLDKRSLYRAGMVDREEVDQALSKLRRVQSLSGGLLLTDEQLGWESLQPKKARKGGKYGKLPTMD